MRYNLTAAEILHLLGGHGSLAVKQKTEAFEQLHKVTQPVILSDFIKIAADNPLLKTADIWTTASPFFFYDEIKEQIDDMKDDWEEDPDECENDEYYQYSRIPTEQWPDLVNDYLEIGSDYGAGMVTFGICVTDLKENDPPVYMHHEANSLTNWQRFSDHLSDFLITIVGDVLSCAAYQTAQAVLDDLKLHYQIYNGAADVENLLSEAAIDLSAARCVPSLYGTKTNVYCCYDEEHTLYVIRKGDKEYQASVITVK